MNILNLGENDRVSGIVKGISLILKELIGSKI